MEIAGKKGFSIIAIGLTAMYLFIQAKKRLKCFELYARLSL